jgi:hypothetical protein
MYLQKCCFLLTFTCNLRFLSLFHAKHNMHGLAFLTAQQVPSTTYLSRTDEPTYPNYNMNLIFFNMHLLLPQLNMYLLLPQLNMYMLFPQLNMYLLLPQLKMYLLLPQLNMYLLLPEADMYTCFSRS